MKTLYSRGIFIFRAQYSAASYLVSKSVRIIMSCAEQTLVISCCILVITVIRGRFCSTYKFTLSNMRCDAT